MRIGICGGAYGNPYALRAFVADARGRGCQRLVHLGDLGGFGAEINPLWSILADNGVECIAGNYEVAIARADPDCGCGYRDPRDNAYAQLVYDHTLAHTSRDFAAWMGALPSEHRERIEGLNLHFVHGSPLAINDFWWESRSEDQHADRIVASGADVICCTHSGLPWQRRFEGTLVVNVGAIGKPANDGRRSTWYAILDIDAGHAVAELIPLDYDWHAQATSMRTAGLPEAFVETIETGWWTTCLEVLPPRERSAGRFQLYRSMMPTGFQPAGDTWGPGTTGETDESRPVIPLFGSPYFPSRLWIYTNFHCNLACDYCAVASSPRAAPRTLSTETVGRLVDEAVHCGFTEIYFTGGEPFLHPDIVPLLDYASARLPTVVLTNAMLLSTRRSDGLADLAHRDLVIQTSLDGARATTHDVHRGNGSWKRTMDGIRRLVDLGMPPRVALTETPDNTDDIPAVTDLLRSLDIPEHQFAVRPLLRRGLSPTGLEIAEDTSIPELTVTADGLHWHPAGADLTTSPDMHLADPPSSLETGKRLITERFFHARLADGSLPQPVHCAI